MGSPFTPASPVVHRPDGGEVRLRRQGPVFLIEQVQCFYIVLRLRRKEPLVHLLPLRVHLLELRDNPQVVVFHRFPASAAHRPVTRWLLSLRLVA
jgi:hypothetical protein